MRNKTILVAGGAGFLGSNLCDYYIARGARVICIDNLSTGRLKNVAHLMDIDAFRFVKHDIRAPFDPEEPVHFVYNMASPASPPRYQEDPIATFETNVSGAARLLKMAERIGARILQSSTSEVYGDPLISPQPESYKGNVVTMGPRACYDEGKRAAETLFYMFHERRSVDIRVARIFNTYGRSMDPADGRVVSNFIVQALRGETLTIYGDGWQTRSFCHVDDMIAGLVALMHTDGALAQPVNLGNPDEFTILELAQKVLEETGSISRLEFRDLPADDPTNRRPDISRARALLGWEPQIPLGEGLRRSVAYFVAELTPNLQAGE
jgi:UDP-glucuronate decarboxylase